MPRTWPAYPPKRDDSNSGFTRLVVLPVPCRTCAQLSRCEGLAVHGSAVIVRADRFRTGRQLDAARCPVAR
jgi:hypothetical protein